jgi:hypothetical protein
MSDESLPALTLAIEWDNARDVAPIWVERHLSALQAELLRYEGRWAAPPLVLYLYDSDSVDPLDIRRQIATHAAKLRDCADLRLVPVPGADYFGLKSAGIGLAATEIAVLLDSDVAPQPGWLESLLAPFADREVVASAGFTTIAVDGFVSKVCALAWVYHLPSEAQLPVRKNLIHGNNLAVRTDYYRAHPWRAPRDGKKGGGPFTREIERNGKRWVRTSGARALHAPHRSAWFFIRRGWIAGADQDWVVREKGDSTRLARVEAALRQYYPNARRALRRVVRMRREVDLPRRQVPAALLLAFTHWTATLVAELAHAARR